MRELKVSDILQAASGSLLLGKGNSKVANITTDSRNADEGSLFVALTIGTRDGHDFINTALEKGCRNFLISDEKAIEKAIKKAGMVLSNDEMNFISVKDTLKGLQDLAKWYLSSFPDLKKIAITGSNGKTTTKEFTYHIFRDKYKTIRNIGNFNNHIGVPLTAFSVDEETEVAIFEMGMSDLGEIDVLADIVRPHVVAITNIGVSHMESLKSQENILKAKWEITNYLDKDGVVVINGDDKFLSEKKISEDLEIISVGISDGNNYRINDIENLGENGISFLLTETINIENNMTFHIPIPGSHNAWNAAIAAGIASKYDISLESGAKSLFHVELGDKRLSVKEACEIKIIDDTYNASLDSMKVAIDVLASIESLRKVAILGDMLEIGTLSDDYHYEVGKYASNKDVNVIISFGEKSKHINRGASENSSEVYHFDTKEELYRSLKDIIKKGDGVLVKGSRGMKMEEIVEYLLNSRS